MSWFWRMIQLTNHMRIGKGSLHQQCNIVLKMKALKAFKEFTSLVFLKLFKNHVLRIISHGKLFALYKIKHSNYLMYFESFLSLASCYNSSGINPPFFSSFTILTSVAMASRFSSIMFTWFFNLFWCRHPLTKYPKFSYI